MKSSRKKISKRSNDSSDDKHPPSRDCAKGLWHSSFFLSEPNINTVYDDFSDHFQPISVRGRENELCDLSIFVLIANIFCAFVRVRSLLACFSLLLPPLPVCRHIITLYQHQSGISILLFRRISLCIADLSDELATIVRILIRTASEKLEPKYTSLQDSDRTSRFDVTKKAKQKFLIQFLSIYILTRRIFMVPPTTLLFVDTQSNERQGMGKNPQKFFTE